MVASSPVVIVNMPDAVVDELFDRDVRERLQAVGDVSFVGASGGPERLQADVLVTGWQTPPLPDRLGPTDRVRFIAHSAGTIRSIIRKTLIADGVRVSQSTAALSQSVAEMALYSTISLLRSLHSVDRRMHAERDWKAAVPRPAGDTVAGSTIGVIGASRIGRIYIRLARALGSRVLVHDPFLSETDAAELQVERVPLEDLLRASRVVVNHAPVTDETRGMLDGRRLGLIADGGILINTARAAIIDGAALEAELISGRLSAALDVFDVEPLPASSALWGLPNVLLSPHIGGVTRQARRGQGLITVEEIERYLAGQPLQHEVDLANYDRLA
ncbi:hydroxyacid dehydrogenase [uncultured Microbacterium sp.]|uniref:hydroxyacid dehydrogenase n=1 Tax=uncultured Microbacterium sp. TaxID=191216 RepID=UPI0035CA0BBA